MMILAALVAVSITAPPEPGMAFLERCHGSRAPSSCRVYERGYFDALAVAGAICPAPTVDDMQIQIVAEKWMRGHVNHLDAPARLMLRNAMVNGWPCR